MGARATYRPNVSLAGALIQLEPNFLSSSLSPGLGSTKLQYLSFLLNLSAAEEEKFFL